MTLIPPILIWIAVWLNASQEYFVILGFLWAAAIITKIATNR